MMFYLSMLDNDADKIKMADIYAKYKNRLMNTSLAITKRHDMAEDAVHNTFLSAIKHKEKVFAMDETDFLKWSVIVVKGKSIDLLRRAKYFAEPLPEDLASDDMPVDARIAQSDIYERLIRHIAELDDVNRQIMEMKYLLQMSHAEIGAELGFTAAQIDSRVARARAKVKKRMERELLDNE